MIKTTSLFLLLLITTLSFSQVTSYSQFRYELSERHLKEGRMDSLNNSNYKNCFFDYNFSKESRLSVYATAYRHSKNDVGAAFHLVHKYNQQIDETSFEIPLSDIRRYRALCDSLSRSVRRGVFYRNYSLTPQLTLNMHRPNNRGMSFFTLIVHGETRNYFLRPRFSNMIFDMQLVNIDETGIVDYQYSSARANIRHPKGRNR